MITLTPNFTTIHLKILAVMKTLTMVRAPRNQPQLVPSNLRLKYFCMKRNSLKRFLLNVETKDCDVQSVPSFKTLPIDLTSHVEQIHCYLVQLMSTQLMSDWFKKIDLLRKFLYKWTNYG